MRLLPDGCLDVVWDGQRIRVVRPAARQVRRAVGETAVVVGIRIRPGWAGAVLGAPVRELPDVADLADVWGTATVMRLEARLAAAGTTAAARVALVGLTVSQLARSGDPDPRVLAAVSVLGQPSATVSDAAHRVSLSLRQLRRCFDDHVGLPPKTLQTILRFSRFRAWLTAPGQARATLASAAAECGYYDHAHLCRDCARLAGVTPTLANTTALDAWTDITPLARNEFICWVEDAKQEKTRERRIRRTQEELEEGTRPISHRADALNE